jgi:carbon storage regulator CsrA
MRIQINPAPGWSSSTLSNPFQRTEYFRIHDHSDQTCHASADNSSVGCGKPTIPTPPQQNRTQGRIKMLVLSRKVGEKLVIDGNITVEVVKIQGNRVSLGIVAPTDVKILRGELNQPKTVTQTIEIVVEDGLLVAC